MLLPSRARGVVMETKKFYISRNDDLYNYAEDFEGMFKFSFIKDNDTAFDPGTFFEDQGFDFQKDCLPTLDIKPLDENSSILNTYGKENLSINIFVEDTALKIRQKIHTISFLELNRITTKKFNLDKIGNLCFLQGFIFSCAISLNKNIDENNEVWNKSQILFNIDYTAKLNPEESLFAITYRTFDDEPRNKNVVTYVEWNSEDVSSIPSEETFSVIANERLRDQLKRTENNKNFGNFVIELLAGKIIEELIYQCLLNADIENDPIEDSLHSKIAAFFEKNNFDFNAWSNLIKAGGPDALNMISEISILVQNNLEIGTSLENIKFGGTR